MIGLRLRNHRLGKEIARSLRIDFGGIDPPRKTEPQEVGDFGLRSSIRTGFTGRFAVNVTQVTASNKWLENGLLFRENPAAAVRRESGKRGAFSKAA
jgi:hypothetical protein